MDDEERLLAPKPLSEDDEIDNNLRPKRLNEFIGQPNIKSNLSVFIEAARGREESLDHVLLCGPPGLGKTTLAGIVAREMGAGFKMTSGPALERAGDLAAILSNLEPCDILFIDEIHRLNRTVEEILYPAMEDFQLDIVIGKGPSARTLRLDLPKFTLVGATTRAGLLTSPLRDRFGILSRLDYYSTEELLRIILRSSKILGVDVKNNGAREIAARSRGTPRIANRLLKRVRDYAQVKKGGAVDYEVALESLKFFEVDSRGLDKLDQRLLITLIKKFSGAPVGLNTLAMALGEDPGTIEEVYEPYLVQLGFLKRTPRGRIATARACEHLGIDVVGGREDGGENSGKRLF